MYQTKFLLEREVLIRCLKHILNQYIRDFPSDELVSDLVAHIFNCIFAPSDFLKQMNSEKIKYQPETMQSKSNQSVTDGEKVIKARLKTAESEKANKHVSKKEKKRQKREAALNSARGNSGIEQNADQEIINDD